MSSSALRNYAFTYLIPFIRSTIEHQSSNQCTVNPRLSATRISATFGQPPQIYGDILL